MKESSNSSAPRKQKIKEKSEKKKKELSDALRKNLLRRKANKD